VSQLFDAYTSVDAIVPRFAIPICFEPFTWFDAVVTGEFPLATTVLWQSAQT
jgi:hypothetical protein